MPLEVVESAASASAQLVSYPTAEMSRVEADAGVFFFYSFSLATWTCALVHLRAFSRMEASSLSLDLIVLCEHISCR